MSDPTTSRPVSRRDFISKTAGASLALGLAGRVHAATPTSTPSAAPITPAAPAWPQVNGADETALIEVLRSGRWGRTTGGKRVVTFESTFARRMQARHCIATSSGTTALLTALGALNIGPGDEVVMPAYTFVATFNSITANFALPVFADSDASTFQVDPKRVATALTPATRLILPVHIGGSPANLDALTALARSRNLPLIEDACQAPLAEWGGQPVGTHGLGGCFSFQSSKNLTAGEGGAILTNDDTFADLCYNYHTPGGGRPSPSLGRGANYRLTEFQAALLVSQMARLESQAQTRDANATHLSALLNQITGIKPAALTPGSTRSAWHLYMFRYDAKAFSGLPRAKFIQALAKQGVSVSSGYTRLNTSAHVLALADNPHYQRIYGKTALKAWIERNACPVNDLLVEEALWLPQTKLLSDRSEMERIATVIADIQKRSGDLVRT
ncbi:MAG: DegT/DnrJ/EryC1/StrS family aminotransferase [Opitutaceae bacterium]